MFVCDICGKETRTPASLGAHKRYKHGSGEACPPLAPAVGEVNPPLQHEKVLETITFRSPKSSELRIIIKPSRNFKLETPNGVILDTVAGKMAEFRMGLFSTNDPEIIHFLEYKYNDPKFPVYSNRTLKRLANAS